MVPFLLSWGRAHEGSYTGRGVVRTAIYVKGRRGGMGEK